MLKQQEVFPEGRSQVTLPIIYRRNDWWDFLSSIITLSEQSSNGLWEANRSSRRLLAGKLMMIYFLVVDILALRPLPHTSY